MRRIKGLPRLIIFAVLCALLFSPMQVVQAEELKTITATGTITIADDEPYSLPLTMTFPPAGGKVTGSANYQVFSADFSCQSTTQLNLEGTFVGGDGGSATGTISGTSVTNCKGGDFNLGDLIIEWTGPWSGNFYANGTGNGVYDATVRYKDRTDTGQFTWQVTFSAEEFAAALKPPVTSEYIYTTYGIRVEDSFGGDGYEQTAWSDHELSLLNDVLREIPPDILNNMMLTSIIRNKVDIDENGNQHPGVFGEYSPCDQRMDPNCTGSASIRIYDRASSPYEFTNDPSGDTEFKATILHEMIHAVQYRQNQYSVYDNAYTSPLVQNYCDATRPNTAIEAGINQNGWAWYGQSGWKLYSAPDSLPPTEYGKTNPLEDMSESVMMYVYDPQKLQSSSMQRYTFIRDQIYGGVEYENGVQKKP